MNRKKLTATCCLILILSCSAVFAEEPVKSTGLYFSANLGACLAEDAVINDPSAGSSTASEYNTDTGYVAMVALGYDFGKTRIEGEFGFRENNIDEVSISGTKVQGGSADVNAFSIMFNGFVDFDNPTSLSPYIGAGVGVAKVSVDDVDSSVSGTPIGGHDTQFAFQLELGVNHAVNDALTLGIGYQYFRTAELTFGTRDAEYASHSLLFKLRFKFDL